MKTLAFILILTTLITTVSYSSTEIGISAQAITDARKDADKDAVKFQWLLIGCCFGPVGYAASLTGSPEIPIDRFIGKPPEYVHFYSEEYRRKSKSIQSNFAFGGWVVATLITAFVIATQPDNVKFGFPSQ